MNTKFCMVLMGVSMLSGCVHTVRFYPVQGPLIAQTPSQVLVGKVTGAFNSGNMSVVLKDGQICRGRWATIPRPQKSQTGATASVQATSAMSSVWDAVYGPGFYVSHVLGARLYAQAVLMGNQGTILSVEMYRPVGEHPDDIGVKGVAKDGKDNIYKLTF